MAARLAVPARTLTTEQLLKLQALAIAQGDVALKLATWAAQGLDYRVAFQPVLASEQRRAMQRCVDQAEMLALTGTVL